MKTNAKHKKACGSCSITKPLTDFYKHIGAGHPDGLSSTCKACDKARIRISTKKWKIENPDKWAAQTARYVKANPVKAQAQRKLRYAVSAGVIIKPSKCAECRVATPKRLLAGHHYAGYEAPLSVKWLCDKFHKYEHSLAKAGAA
jgi:hypothetical protein